MLLEEITPYAILSPFDKKEWIGWIIIYFPKMMVYPQELLENGQPSKLIISNVILIFSRLQCAANLGAPVATLTYIQAQASIKLKDKAVFIWVLH